MPTSSDEASISLEKNKVRASHSEKKCVQGTVCGVKTEFADSTAVSSHGACAICMMPSLQEGVTRGVSTQPRWWSEAAGHLQL